MREYVKIHTMFKRDMANNGQLIWGEWSLPEFGYLAVNEWAFTEKVDGTNVRVHWDRGNHAFGGRTANAQMPMFLLDRLTEIFTPDLLESVFDGTFTLYGEGFGAKIQGGGKYSATPEFVLFDVLFESASGPLWLERDSVADIAAKLGVPVVPLVCWGTLYDAIAMVNQGLPSAWGNFEAEGIVARPSVELLNRRGERIITKIKARDFR